MYMRFAKTLRICYIMHERSHTSASSQDSSFRQASSTIVTYDNLWEEPNRSAESLVNIITFLNNVRVVQYVGSLWIIMMHED